MSDNQPEFDRSNVGQGCKLDVQSGAAPTVTMQVPDTTTGVTETLWVDTDNDCAPVIRRVSVNTDGTFNPPEWELSDGTITMTQSANFIPAKPATIEAAKFATNKIDGSSIEVTEVKDTKNGTVTYIDASGADVTATVTAAPSPTEDYVIADYVTSVLLGNEVVSVSGGTPSTLTVPANAGYGYGNVNGADAMYAIGASPLADTDHRVSDGGRIEFRTSGDLAGAQIDALDGASSFNMRVYFYNVAPENNAT